MSMWLKRLLFFFTPVAAGLFAQSQTATLRGIVTDSKGAPLEQVTLVITDAPVEAVVRQVTTWAGGHYQVPYLWPGTYRLAIEHSGYRTFVAEEIVLEPGQVRRFDISLTEGPATETETVQMGAEPVRTESEPESHLLDYRAKWNDAPFADQHPTALRLLTTMPAVQGIQSGLVLSGISSRDQQTWATDGVPDHTSGQTGNPAFYETAEVTIAGAGVEAARPAGFNLISKRGRQGVHGLAYYKRGSSAFNARSYFDAAKPPYKLSEAAGEMGWPLISGWTYLYGGGMYQKLPYRQTMYADVPTERMRQGDLSEFLNPATSPTGKAIIIRDPRTRAPLSGNVVPPNRISSVSRNYINSYYPSPNTGQADAFGRNYTWIHTFGPETYNGNWPFVRLDQKISASNQMFLRWLQNQTAAVTPGSVDRRLDATRSGRYRNLVFSDMQAFSSRLVNRLTLGWARFRVKQGQSEADVDPMKGDSVVSTLGLQGVNPGGYSSMGFPAVSINGFTGLSMAYGGGREENVAHQNGIFSLEDSAVWSFGRHAVKAGVQYTRYSWTEGEIPLTVYGAFTFTGAFTGSALSDFLFGLPATSTRRNIRLPRELSQDQAGAFLADSFRLSKRLTLECGVRWDYYGTPVYDDGYMVNWDPASGQVVVAPGTYTAVSPYYPKSITVTAGEVVPEAKFTNVRPRVSAAYQIGEKVVARGSYGEFTESLGYGTAGRLNPTDPYSLTETYTNTISGGVAALSFPRPFPSSPSSTQMPGQSVTGYPMKTEEGTIRQFHASLEAVLRETRWRAAYIGMRGTGMNYAVNINKPRASTIPFAAARKPYPAFAGTMVIRNDGEWRYDSLVLAAARRTGPVSFDASFTWGDNRSNYANTIDPYHVTSQWTRDGANRRRYFVGTLSWPLPVGKGRRLWSGAGPVTNWLVSDWTLNAIATFASGQYFSVWFTGPDPANASEGLVTQLPDCVGDPNRGARTPGRWFDPAAFAAPPAGAGRYGSCGMNILEGYPIHAGHASLVKRFALGEAVRAVFTAQVSNVTNTPHFTIPNSNISEANAGAFTAASVLSGSAPGGIGARQIDFKLRLEW